MSSRTLAYWPCGLLRKYRARRTGRKRNRKTGSVKSTTYRLEYFHQPETRNRSQAMLVHIVSFKYKSDTPESTREDHRARLRGLAELAWVDRLDVGEDVVRSGRSYDTGLVVVFR